MGKLKYSKRIDITIDIKLLERVDKQVTRFGTSRSGLIRWALQDWLEAHPDPAKQVKTMHKFDPEKSFKDYIKPGMSGDELVDMLEAYEKADPYRL